MFEKTNLFEKERQDKAWLENQGLRDSGPLTPEFVKKTYDWAYRYDKATQDIGESLDKESEDYHSQEIRAGQQADAEEYRAAGRTAVGQAVQEAKQYVNKNNGAYYEQAKADMDADLTKRRETDEFASTLDDIQSLPEARGPNN